MLKNKEKFDLELETMGPIFCKGIGYQHDEWKHGIWKGESETGYEVWDLATIDPADYTFSYTSDCQGKTGIRARYWYVRKLSCWKT